MAQKKLGEILDLAHLQRLQDAFAAVANITTVVIDAAGAPLTRPSNLYGFCQLMQENPAGVQQCMHTNQKLCQENCRSQGPSMLTCPHSGLATAAVPIFLEGKHLGSWIIGQARMEDPAPAVLAETARKTGVSQQALQAAIDSLPRTNEQKFENIFTFLKTLSETILRLSQIGNEMAKNNVELRLITAQFENTSDMLRKFVDASGAGMYVTDFETGELLMVNKKYRDTVAPEEEEILGKKCWLLGLPGSQTFCPYCPRDKLLDAEGNPAPAFVWENYLPHIGAWMRITSQAIPWGDGRMAHMVTYLDITHERTMRDGLAKLAFYDSQMNLPNGLKLQRDIEAASDAPDQFLVCFDVGGLRRVNDAYDRATGDLLLKTVVGWVARQEYGGGELYRIESDAFGLYLKGVTRQKARAVARSIDDRFKKAWVLQQTEGQEVTLLCRVAVALINMREGISSAEILTLIERMLDESRITNGVVIYNEEMDKISREHVRLEMSLKNCVQNGMQGFDVHFQPIVEPAAGTWKGLEALCRWTDPETRLPVPPLVFIKEAEQRGLIREIGFFVLERAISCCKAWGLDAVDEFFVSVNLSPDQVMDANFVDHVTGLLKKYDFPGENLILEVTESTEFTFNAYSLKAINNLRFRGVRFSLDDFGTGYSSFNNLKNMPVSMLKTERDFITGIETDNYMQYFFYTMAELAHAADMCLIAEGVETAGQLAMILKNGADFVQGYYFSKPLPADEVGKSLARFTHVDPSLYQMSNRQFTEQIFSGKDAYLMSPKLFKVLNQSMQVLLNQVDMDRAFDEVLEIVGRHFGISRVYVFLKTEGTIFANTHEWCAAGIAPRREKLGHFDVDKYFPGWIVRIVADRMIVSGNADQLPEGLRAGLRDQEIKALAVLPLFDEDVLIGFVGLDDRRYREWMLEEIAMLRNLCMTMASTLKKERLKQQLFQTDVRFSDVLNNMGLAIMVTDPKTHEILWKNEEMKALYAFPETGEVCKCYQVLRGQTEPCFPCKVTDLLQNPGRKHCARESYNQRTGRYFMMNDSLVRWADGRQVHLQYAMDIDEIKKAHNKLAHLASTD